MLLSLSVAHVDVLMRSSSEPLTAVQRGLFYTPGCLVFLPLVGSVFLMFSEGSRFVRPWLHTFISVFFAP